MKNDIPNSLIPAQEKGQTTYFQANISNCHVQLPKKLNWKDIEFPQQWKLPTKTLLPPPEQITHEPSSSHTRQRNGYIEISFNRNLTPSTSSTSPKEKVSQKFL